MSKTIANLMVGIGVDASKLEPGIKKAKASINSIQGATKEVSDGFNKLSGMSFLGISVGAAAAATAIIGIGTACINAAGQMEQTQMAFSTMLGSGEKANKLLNELKDFAANTPFEFTEIAAASKKLLAFGVSADKVKPSLKAIGDVSSAIGAPIGEIAELYGKAKTQGRLFAEDINQLTGRGIPIIGQLAKQFGVTDAEVKNLVENGEVGFDNLEIAFQDLSSEGGQFYDMMASQNDTLLGKWSNFQDSLGQISVFVGDKITEALGLKGVIEGMSGALAIFKQGMAGEGDPSQLTGWDTEIYNLGQDAAITFEAIKTGISDMKDQFQVDSPGILKVIKDVDDSINNVKRSAGQPIEVEPGSIMAFLDDLILMSGQVDTVLNNTLALLQDYADFARQVFTLDFEGGNKTLDLIDQDLARFPEAFKVAGQDAATAYANGLAERSGEPTQKAIDMHNGVLGAIGPLEQEALGIGRNSAQSVGLGIDVSAPLVNTAALGIYNTVSGNLSPLEAFGKLTGSNTIGEFGQGIIDATNGVLSGVGSFAEAVMKKFREMFDSHSDSKETIKLGYDVAHGLITGMNGTNILGFINSMVKDALSAFGDLTGIGNLIWPTATTALTSLFGNRESPTPGASSYHEGVDIGAAFGETVMASGSGRVIQSGSNGGYGNSVTLDLGNGLTALYAHLSEVFASVGESVSAGQRVGAVGSTGISTGAHLHYSLYQDGVAIDPTTETSGGGVSSDLLDVLMMLKNAFANGLNITLDNREIGRLINDYV